MDYDHAVRQTWRHSEPILMRSNVRELVRYATLAASSHNTQPWRFEITTDEIRILADLTRRCSAVDPDDHHLYASLGCAAENLLLAAEAAGFKGSASFDADGTGLVIALENASPHRARLFDAVLSRQCSRVEFDGRPLSSENLCLLEASAQVDGVLISDRTTPASDAAPQAQPSAKDYPRAGHTRGSMRESAPRCIEIAARRATRPCVIALRSTRLLSNCEDRRAERRMLLASGFRAPLTAPSYCR